MQLKDFLRPPSDNGRGIHFGLDVRQDKLDFHMHLIAALGMNWIVFYVGDEIQAANCARAAWAQHIMPIIRPACKIDGQILDWTRITLSVLSCAPAAWVQIFNEPGDNREWKLEEPYMRLLVANYGLTMEQAKRQIQKRIEMAPWKGHYNRDLLVQRWRQAASMVVEAGGYPGLQSMDPDEINAILVGVDDSVKDKMFFASHSYGSNHPPSYPYDARNQQDHPGATIFDDDTCALRWMEEREWVKRAIGFYPPLIITEGGWFYQQSEDNRYPRTDDALHAQYHVTVFDQFRLGKLANSQALTDDLFAYCPWMWSDADWDSWYNGVLGTRQQTIDAVKAMPVFVRKFSWDGIPTPEPVPDPTPKPEPPVTPITKSKLGIYVTPQGGVDIEWFAKAKPRVAVSMNHNPDFWKQVKIVSPNTFILGRHYTEQQPLDNPAVNANTFFKCMIGEAEMMRGIYHGWMSYNEPAIWNKDDALALCEFMITWVKLVHEAGFKAAVYSFSEGHPELDLWQYLLEGLRVGDFLALHEYDAPTMFRTQSWRCLRYRRVREILPVYAHRPIIISECGIDGGVTGIDKPQQGWRAFGDANHYLESLRWYDAALKIDDYVIGAAIFAAAWDTGGGTFDMGKETAIEMYIGEQGDAPVPTPTPVPAPAGIEEAVLVEAKKYTWMPINTEAALYKFAQTNKLGYPQTNEFEFTYNGAAYVGQVFNLGIAYSKKGDWSNVKWVKKP